MRCLLIIFLFITPLSIIIGQKERSILLKPGITSTFVRDNYFSTITYSAILPGLDISYNVQAEQYINYISFFSSTGKLKPLIANNNSQKYFQFSFDWIRVYELRMNNNKKHDFYLGGKWTNSYSYAKHSMFGDNQISFMFYSSLGPSFAINYRINEKYTFNLNLNFNILSYIIRPAYTRSVPENAIDKEDWGFWSTVSGGKMVSLDRFQNIGSLLNFKYDFSDHFAGQIAYHWNFVNYSGQNKIYRANHFINLGLNYTF